MTSQRRGRGTQSVGLEIGFTITLADALDAAACYAVFGRWAAGQGSWRNWLAAHRITLIGLAVQSVGAVLVIGLLTAIALHGAHLVAWQRAIAEWAGLCGLLGFYAGLVPVMRRAQLRRSVIRALRRSDADLFAQARPGRLRIEAYRLLLRLQGRQRIVSIDPALTLIDTGDLLVLLPGGVLVPLRPAAIGPNAADRLRRAIAGPRPSQSYFVAVQRLEIARFTAGLTILALSFWLFLLLRHAQPHG